MQNENDTANRELVWKVWTQPKQIDLWRVPGSKWEYVMHGPDAGTGV
jgi:uncharacterized protein YndB with AHSA1/START domain